MNKLISRYWIRYKGRIVKFLAWENYEQCFYGKGPRSFLYRLPDNDPRPLGHHLLDGEYDDSEASWYDRLPIGQWAEIV